MANTPAPNLAASSAAASSRQVRSLLHLLWAVARTVQTGWSDDRSLFLQHLHRADEQLATSESNAEITPIVLLVLKARLAKHENPFVPAVVLVQCHTRRNTRVAGVLRRLVGTIIIDCASFNPFDFGSTPSRIEATVVATARGAMLVIAILGDAGIASSFSALRVTDASGGDFLEHPARTSTPQPNNKQRAISRFIMTFELLR